MNELTPGNNRYNFWSSFNAKPKSKYKFLVRFGGSGFFKSQADLNIDLASGIDTEKFKDLKAIAQLNNMSNLGWLVKSIDRPKFSVEGRKQYQEADGEVIGFEAAKIENLKWTAINVKLVNISSHTFHPNEVPTDLDLLLSTLIDQSGYRFSSKKEAISISDLGLPLIQVGKSNKDPMQIRSKALFDPFEIIDLSTDYLPDYPKELPENQNNFKQEFGNPISKQYLQTQRTYPVGKWTLHQPYLKEVSFGDNNYENDNAFIEYNLQIGYMWATYESYVNDDPAKTLI